MSNQQANKPEKFFSVRDVKHQFFPSRSARWIKDTFKSGRYGPVMRDAAGWFFSEKAIYNFQQQRLVTAPNIVALRSSQLALRARNSG